VNINKSLILLFLGAVIAVMAIAMFTSPAAAQGCLDPSGKPAPCPPAQPPNNPPSDNNEPSGKKRPTKTPTYIPIKRPTKTPTNVPSFTPTTVPSFTPTNVPTFTPTTVLSIPSNIPPLYPTPYLYPGGGTYPYKNPPHDPTCIICPQTWQWWAGGGVVFLIALGGFLYLLFRGSRGQMPGG
jgi:hypothetical protein